MIQTLNGDRPVEHLSPGDYVMTADHGPQRLLWIGRREVDFCGPANIRAEKDKPVQIKSGSLGDGLPMRDLIVSPQHRFVVRNLDTTEYLARAKHLTGLPGVRTMKGRRKVTYYTLLFKQHEIIFAEGSATESFRPGPVALSGFSPKHRTEIFRLYPGLADDPEGALGPIARPVLKRHEVRDLLKSQPLQHCLSLITK